MTESGRHRVRSSERRRAALEVLRDETAPVDLDELAPAVAARETDSKSLDESFVERVRISLHHAHLPKMADFGVVDYDAQRRRITAFGFSSL